MIRRRIHSRDAPVILMSYFAEALDLLSAHGFKRSRNQTALEFARGLAGHAAGPPFEALTHLYNRTRFGAGKWAADNAEAAGLLRSLREQLHRRPM